FSAPGWDGNAGSRRPVRPMRFRPSNNTGPGAALGWQCVVSAAVTPGPPADTTRFPPHITPVGHHAARSIAARIPIDAKLAGLPLRFGPARIPTVGTMD